MRGPSPAATGTVVIEPSSAGASAYMLLASLFVAVTAYSSGTLREILDGEQGIVENVSAVAYLIGLAAAVRAARMSPPGWLKAHWIMWAVFCVLFFGEETSWLQHWVGYETPDYMRRINAQSEVNLHNLEFLPQNEHLVSEQGHGFSWKALLSPQQLFNAGFTFYFLVMPLLSLNARIRGFAQRLCVPELRPRFIAAVWVPIAVSIVLTIVHRGHEEPKSLIAETREMFFALTIMWLLTSAFAYVRKDQVQTATRAASAPLRIKAGHSADQALP